MKFEEELTDFSLRLQKGEPSEPEKVSAGHQKDVDLAAREARKDELEKLAQILPLEPPKMDIAVFDTGTMYQRTLKARLAELSDKEVKND